MSFLKRVQMPYTPSIDNYGDLDADQDGNDNAKKGRRYSHAAAEQRRYKGVHELSTEKKQKVKAELQSIAASLKQRIIKPTNNRDYERLRESEITSSESRGPAALTLFHKQPAAKKRRKNDGSYNVAEFADLLSAVEKPPGEQTNYNAAGEEDLPQHKHTVRDTVLFQLKHFTEENCKAFVEDDMFSCRLIMLNEPSLCALMQMSQFDAAESALDKFKQYYPKQMSKVFGEFVQHFADQCGLRLFCAYVATAAPDALFAAFEMDCIQRYFLTIVFRVHREHNGDTLMQKARAWCDEALENYKKDMLDVNTNIVNSQVKRAIKPCAKLGKQDTYWALYDITASKLLQNQQVTFLYGYYTACQCVNLAQNPK